MPRQSVRTQQKPVPRADIERPFHINFNIPVRPQTASNHVARMQQLRILGRCPPLANHFPLQTVIKRQLLYDAVAYPINATVAHVPHPGSGRRQCQCAAGRPHVGELRVLPRLFANRVVGRIDRFAEPSGRCVCIQFDEGQRQRFHRNPTGEVPDRMAPHSIRHDKQMPLVCPLVVFRAQAHSQRVLIGGPPHSDIGE